ncbi:major facilitator superfamily domain-containing protein [Halteromyces radiatus]|uniref:major facilitator superfamily domain-containing protein n=1 Tax=Halteromyces radiatus TaxID=101107 RepID=UPI00221E4656|nr:major facilitator superfamily domain-containing protein [Halteromyces radiatus]KAI8099304.1 major facilitator superfamily domain-containing protein [Halteromyces radiatus]
MTFVLNMDRTNISNAVSDNLAANLGFTNDGVNTGTLLHSVLFTVVTLPNNAIVKKVGAHLWIPILMSSWAIVTWAHIFITDFSSFLAVRAFISITEAGFIPSCLAYLTGFYTSRELLTRLAWFWGIQSFASAVSGLISFGVFRLAGIGGLYGWKWLFLIDGLFTQLIGLIAFLYLPSGPGKTSTVLWGKKGWFTERERKIAVTRLVRDDLTKTEQMKKVQWSDAKLALLDTNLWTHLIITFLGVMPTTPIGTYLPTMIRSYGFDVTTANLLTAPSYIISLIISIALARFSERFGYMGFISAIQVLWGTVGYLALEFVPPTTGRWGMYAVALFTASTPFFHGLHIAWMSANLAPIGKRTLALGAIIGFANICGVPGSQIYQTKDAPYYHTGNWVLVGITVACAILLIFQHFRYKYTNQYRERKWNAMTEDEKNNYLLTTKHQGSERLDFRFDI